MMYALTYYVCYKNMKNTFNLRYNMVMLAINTSISEAARQYATTRKTVRKWLKRYNQQGIKGLKDLSKAPKNPYRKTSQEKINEVLRIRRNFPYKGAYRIVEEHKIELSYSTVARILKRHNLTKKTKTKTEKKRDLRAVKQAMRSFQKIELDVKYLNDMKKYFPYYAAGYPKYQFSARDVRTGLTWISYAYEKTTTNMGLFVLLVLTHLRNNNVDFGEIELQSDNGVEFIGSYKAKKAKTAYQKITERLGVKTTLIPPGRPTFNSDVEAFHRLIEEEFYDMEEYRDIEEFLNKAFSYMSYFNIQRRFRYKGGKTPLEILIADRELRKSEAIKLALFYPVILDYLFPLIFYFFQTGYLLLRSDKGEGILPRA